MALYVHIFYHELNGEQKYGDLKFCLHQFFRNKVSEIDFNFFFFFFDVRL